MTKKRMVPCLNVGDGRVVEDTQFQSLRGVDDPVDLALHYNGAGADGLVFLDISKTEAGHNPITEVTEAAVKQLFIPLTVGGGIQNLDDITQLLNHGADKVPLDSSALRHPGLARQANERFNRRRICIAIDSLHGKDRKDYFYTMHGGKKLAGIGAYNWVQEVELLGAGELLVTSMHHDGMKQGFDIKHLAKIKQLVSIPIIASGGGRDAQHFVESFQQTDISAGLAASILHNQETTVAGTKDKMREGGILMR